MTAKEIQNLQRRSSELETAMQSIFKIASTNFQNLDDLSDAVLLIKDTSGMAMEGAIPSAPAINQEEQDRIFEIAFAVLQDDELLADLNIHSTMEDVGRQEQAMLTAKLSNWQDGGGR